MAGKLHDMGLSCDFLGAAPKAQARTDKGGLGQTGGLWAAAETARGARAGLRSGKTLADYESQTGFISKALREPL